MGHRISYCSSCGIQLREADFEKGKACRIGERSFCSPCAEASVGTLPPQERRDPPGSAARQGATGPGRGPMVSDTPSRSMRHVAPTRRRTLLWPLLAAAAAAALVGISLLALAARPSPHPQGPGPPSPAVLAPPPKPPAPGENPRETRAREILGKAKELARLKPDDLSGQVAAWEEAVRTCAGTPYSDAARKELEDALRRKDRKKDEAELAALDAELKAARDREEFARATALLEEARKRRTGADWAGLIEQRLRELDAAAKARYQSLQQAALEARLRGDEPEVKKLRERAMKWGIAGRIAELEAALAEARPAAAPRSPDAAALDAAWEKALATARSRDYAASVKELEGARDSMGDASLKAEAARDAEVLKSVAALHAEAVLLLSKSPKGGALSLKVRDGRGAWSPVEGVVLRASAHRLDLRQGDGTAVVLVGELAADSLVEIARKAPVDARTAAAFCLLDRDVESARRREGQAPGGLSERFWSAAAKFGEAAVEQEARAQFHAALRDYRDPLSRTACAEKCGALLRGFADTAFVRRNRAAVAEGCEAGKDYFFAAGDLAASGTFKTSTHPKAGPCWTSTEDGARDLPKENYVELAFSALPQTEYRCWAWVGACCAETFAFHCQATDLLAPDPKDPNRIHPAGPGEAIAAPVRHGIQYLRNSHSGHGGPKEPKRWEWVAIVLPKYSSGGPKKVRLLSDQKGFSVAAAVVSAARRTPPSEPEAKEEQELAAARGPAPGTAAPQDAFVDLFNGKDLAGWRTRFGTWRVEEGALVTDTPGDGGRFLIDTTESYGDYEVTYKLSVTRQAYMEPRFHGGVKLGGFMVSAGEWHDFRGVASGGKIEAFLDGKKMRELDVQETAGPIGFFTVGGDKLRIKEVRLRKLK